MGSHGSTGELSQAAPIAARRAIDTITAVVFSGARMSPWRITSNHVKKPRTDRCRLKCLAGAALGR
jgi:hypothetical protein